MKLVVTEKNDAAQKIADLLGATKPKADKVYSTPVYRFTVDGEDWVTIGLRGHILEPLILPQRWCIRSAVGGVAFRRRRSYGGRYPQNAAQATVQKKKPFTEDGVELKA